MKGIKKLIHFNFIEEPALKMNRYTEILKSIIIQNAPPPIINQNASPPFPKKNGRGRCKFANLH